MLFPIRPEGTQLSVYKGSQEPLRGWLPGDHEPDYVPAPQINLKTDKMKNTHDYFVSIMIPSRGQDVPEVSVEAESPMGTVGHLTLRWKDGTTDEIHWGCGFNMMIGKHADFETDSSLIHLRRTPDGSIDGGCCINGTYLKPFVNGVRTQAETFAISPQA